jgi:hypothetical protein
VSPSCHLTARRDIMSVIYLACEEVMFLRYHKDITSLRAPILLNIRRCKYSITVISSPSVTGIRLRVGKKIFVVPHNNLTSNTKFNSPWFLTTMPHFKCKIQFAMDPHNNAPLQIQNLIRHGSSQQCPTSNRKFNSSWFLTMPHFKCKIQFAMVPHNNAPLQIQNSIRHGPHNNAPLQIQNSIRHASSQQCPTALHIMDT